MEIDGPGPTRPAPERVETPTAPPATAPPKSAAPKTAPPETAPPETLPATGSPDTVEPTDARRPAIPTDPAARRVRASEPVSNGSVPPAAADELIPLVDESPPVSAPAAPAAGPSDRPTEGPSKEPTGGALAGDEDPDASASDDEPSSANELIPLVDESPPVVALADVAPAATTEGSPTSTLLQQLLEDADASAAVAPDSALERLTGPIETPEIPETTIDDIDPEVWSTPKPLNPEPQIELKERAKKKSSKPSRLERSRSPKPPAEPATTAKKPAMLPVLALALLAALGAVVFLFFRGRDTTPATPANTDGTTSIFSFADGDCVAAEVGSAGEPVSSLQRIDCSVPHQYEIFHISQFQPLTAEYNRDAINDFASRECAAAFEQTVGIAFEDSRFTFILLNPTEESWAEQDRSTLCLGFDPEGLLDIPLTGAQQ